MEVKLNSDEWRDWIEDSISKKDIKYYDYKHFSNMKEIDADGYGKSYRVNWKNLEQFLSLKSFKTFDKIAVKELVHELKLRREIDFHSNIIRLYGITTSDEDTQNDDKPKEYIMVTEYADGGSLQKYLKENFNRLTWKDKYNLAYQLSCAVSCLHEEGIFHLDLHSKSVLVHQNIIKLADFGLTNRIEEASKKKSKLYNNIPYIDPKRLMRKHYKLDNKSDVYSIGVILWEISSGKPPFYIEGKSYDVGLVFEISQGARENPIPGTPDAYVKIYTECWKDEPCDRPNMNEVVDRLRSVKDKVLGHKERERIQYNNYLEPSSDGTDGLSGTSTDRTTIRSNRHDSINNKIFTMVNGINGLINNIHEMKRNEMNRRMEEEDNQERSERKICENILGAENVANMTNVISEIENAVKSDNETVKSFVNSAEGLVSNILHNSYENDDVRGILDSVKGLARNFFR